MFKTDFIQENLNAKIPSRLEFKRIWADSRSLKQGDLFAAIPGEKFDGHDFIIEAVKAGAFGALIEKADFKDKSSIPPDFCLIQVPNTTEALRSLAQAHRQRLKTRIFGVGGSNGKTTTKEWLAFLLAEAVGKEKVFKTLKSNNSILGIALSLLQIRNEDYAVIEIGIDEPGWMQKHLEIVQPNAGVITMIGEEHLENLKNIETVAEEELKLLDYLRKNSGAFAANMDSPWIAKASLPESSRTYSLDGSAQIEGQYSAPQFLSVFGISWTNPLPGKHNAQNLLAAITSLQILIPDLSVENLKKLALSANLFRGEAHRSLWLTTADNIRIYDDCYNANPESMERSFETFEDLSKGCNQKLVLGDMLDLGDSTEKSHARILNLALVSNASEIFLFGPHFHQAFQKLDKSMNRKGPKINSFLKIEDLKSAVKKSAEVYDCFLLKGSRGMALERVLEVFNV